MLGIYCRRSGSKDESASIETQREEGLKFANENGFDNYRIFSDDSISGAKSEIKDRPEFAVLYDEITKGNITAVYAIDQSRIERNSKIWNLFVHAMTSSNCDYYPNGELFDLNDPNNKFVSQVMSAANELYASLTSHKVKLAHDKNASKGKTHGITPYGYKRNEENGLYEIIPKEADVIERIYNLSIEGNGTYTIARMLNEENIPTKFNRFDGYIKRKDDFTSQITKHKKENVKWRGNVVYDMITNTVYKGKRRWKENFYDVPAIIKTELCEKANKNLKQNKKKVGKKAEYSYLLNGIIFCSHCNKEYRGKKRPKGTDNAYKCAGRRPPNPSCSYSRGISLPKIETFIIKHLFHKKSFKQNLLEQKVNLSQTSLLLKKQKGLLDLSKKLDKKIELATNRLLDIDLANDPNIIKAYKELKTKKEETEKKLLQLQERIAIADENVRKKRIQKIFDEYVDDIDFISLKKLVHSLIKRIEVHWNVDNFGKGYYLFQIDYHLYDERIIYATDIKAMKWLLMSRYRKVATNEDELENDKSLAEEFGWVISDDFKGLETRDSGDYDLSVELKREEFIHFD